MALILTGLGLVGAGLTMHNNSAPPEESCDNAYGKSNWSVEPMENDEGKVVGWRCVPRITGGEDLDVN